MISAFTFTDLVTLTNGKRGTFDVPCPDCGPGRQSPANRKRAVLRIWCEDPHFLTYKCARCGASGYAHDDDANWEPGDNADRRVHPAALKAWDAAAVDREADLRLVWTPEQQTRIDSAARIWAEATEINGTLAETYLAEFRCIANSAHFSGNVLRFHPRCPGATRTPARPSCCRR